MLSKILKFGLRQTERKLASYAVPFVARFYFGRRPLENHAPGHLVAVGGQYLLIGNVDRAFKLFLAAIDQNPDMRVQAASYVLEYLRRHRLDDERYFDVLRRVGRAKNFAVVNLDVELLRGGLGRDPERLGREIDAMPPRRPERDALIALGSDALAIARHQLALQSYERALDQASNDPQLLEQIGITKFLAGRYVDSETAFAAADYLKHLERDHLGGDAAPVAVLDHSWLLAIGHVAFLDTYIKACRLGWFPEKKSVLVYDKNNLPAGWPLFKFFSEHLEIVGTDKPVNDKIEEFISSSIVLRKIDGPAHRTRVALSRSFWYGPDRDQNIRWYGPWGAAVEREWKDRGNKALFSLSGSEQKMFRQRVERIYGLPKDAWYVLLHVREPGFHASWHAHHAGTRNAEISAYDEVIDFVLSKGGWVVRGGDPSMTRLQPRERVIDYATNSQRHPALDIYLCAECAYFIGTNSGFSVLPPVFGKRCGLTNWSPIAIPNWYPDDLYIPKLVRKISENRYLSFEEMYGSFAGWSQFVRDFSNSDYAIEDNSAEDLREVTEELHNEVFGLANISAAEDDPQLHRFNAIAVAHGSYVGSRMGRRFLKKYAHLIDQPSESLA